MKTKLKKAYYAHTKRIYGNKREAEEMAYISSVFDGIVICPNNHLGERKSMRAYLVWLSIADAVFVSEYKNKIGKGVYEECETALPAIVALIGRNFYFWLHILSARYWW